MTDLRTLDLKVLNSAAKYPQIDTYHEIDRGRLLEKTVAFCGEVYLTEKVDGTNARIIVAPNGDFVLGNREHLLYARGDFIANPAEGIVDALRGLAGRITAPEAGLRVYYLEVYGMHSGGKITRASAEYTGSQAVGYRLFDAASIAPDVLTQPVEAISAWRKNGGQRFHTEQELSAAAEQNAVALTPRLGSVPSSELPTGLKEMQDFLAEQLPATRAALDDGGTGRPEGIVLRTADRSVIAKARFEDYARTFNSRTKR
ncbi:RNA ligase family protein [Streptomyces europaeiscabiei]|uniref:RNA ligase family protein n=1 Tax=Streptomyces europaeiscabiei TaxID=146819 RepID=UPI0038F60DCF